MTRRFATLDVFTATALAGNPLAVVLDAEGLSDAAMQRIAREFNLSETVFVLPPANPHTRAALRIFTPGRELPFAGHPTVGTAVLLALKDHGGQHGHVAFDLEERVGLVPCAVEVERGDRATASFTLPRLPWRVEDAQGAAALAAALGLTARDIALAGHQPSVFSAGNGFTFVPVRDQATLARAWPVPARWSAIGPKDHPNAFVYTREVSDPAHHYRARMFAPDMSIAEDPATGSAVAAFAGVVMAYDHPDDGVHRLVIEQGYEMGRPSQITLQLTVEGGALVSAAIGGQAVVVSEGVLHL